jgi:hypothetical protein
MVQLRLESAKALRALNAPNNSSSLMWRSFSSLDQDMPVVTPSQTAPHPDKDASEQIENVGSASNIDLPWQEARLAIHHNKSDLAESVRLTLLSNFPL